MTHRTLHSHLAAMRRHDLPHDVEPEPCAAWFRGMQRFKNLGVVLRGDTNSGIAHIDLGPGAISLSVERERPSLGHGVHGIVHQVEQGAPEGIWVEGHGTELIESVQKQGNALHREH